MDDAGVVSEETAPRFLRALLDLFCAPVRSTRARGARLLSLFRAGARNILSAEDFEISIIAC